MTVNFKAIIIQSRLHTFSHFDLNRNKILKPTSQCIEAVKSANKTLGMISRSFMFKDKNTTLRLHKSLIRPKWNIQSRLGGPTLGKTDLLEKVQRRATKLMFRYKSVGYYERLSYLGLTTLETRQLR